MSTPEARANIEKLLEELIGLTLLMALRDHGEQGWELVRSFTMADGKVMSDQRWDSWTLFFKRPEQFSI